MAAVPAVSATPVRYTALVDGPLAFVDVESTGGDARFDRLIEVGIVTARAGVLEGEWSTLVNPERTIPAHIEALTGISNEMVEAAPTFAEVSGQIEARLKGRLFVAHNASVDRSFIRNELKRTGRIFSPRSLCTVRLSRRFFPEAQSHALDSVIQRLGCVVERRHRALDDAQVLWKLWQAVLSQRSAQAFEEVLAELVGLTTLPSQLPADLADELPESPGVYRFYGEQRALLYVGQSRSIRNRVLAHFNGAHRNATDRQLKTLVRDIEWTETAGALGAEIAEVRCIREAHPAYNKRLTHSRPAFTVRLAERVREWPFAGPIGVREHPLDGPAELHVFCDWRYVGTAHDDDELAHLLERVQHAEFDVDLYRILRRYLRRARPRGELIQLKQP